MRLLVIALAVLGVSVACTNTKGGTAVAIAEPPHDVWQLAERTVNAVPLTVAKMDALLGISMVQDPQTPGRWEGGRITLAPGLTVASSVIGMKDTWTFADIEIEPDPCVPLDEVHHHYPSAALQGIRNPHAPVPVIGWAVEYPWGTLGFGVRGTDNCVVRIYLHPSDTG